MFDCKIVPLNLYVITEWFFRVRYLMSSASVCTELHLLFYQEQYRRHKHSFLSRQFLINYTKKSIRIWYFGYIRSIALCRLAIDWHIVICTVANLELNWVWTLQRMRIMIRVRVFFLSIYGFPLNENKTFQIYFGASTDGRMLLGHKRPLSLQLQFTGNRFWATSILFWPRLINIYDTWETYSL